MPINLPNLDDRSYSDLVEEGRSLIPTYAPEWTNHNSSDPGITLVEMFAYLSEMLIYRLNRITDDNKLSFLKLLNGPAWKPSPEKSLGEEMREAVMQLREPNRAVTCEDFERLATAVSAEVARARCIAERNLEAVGPAASSEKRPGHISVVVLPSHVGIMRGLEVTRAGSNNQKVSIGPGVATDRDGRELALTAAATLDLPAEDLKDGLFVTIAYGGGAKSTPESAPKPPLLAATKMLPAADSPVVMLARVSTGGDGTLRVESPAVRQQNLLRSVRDDMEPRRLIATSVHVVGPTYLKLGVQLTLYLKPDADEKRVPVQAIESLRRFLHPQSGGPEGRGWPFGRNVYVSEIYELFDELPGVDFITKSIDAETRKPLDELVVKDAARLKRNAEGEIVSAELQAHELVDVNVEPVKITVVRPKMGLK